LLNEYTFQHGCLEPEMEISMLLDDIIPWKVECRGKEYNTLYKPQELNNILWIEYFQGAGVAQSV
jgi:hypothetical protein